MHKASPVLIGSFVIGAVALIVVGVVVFGSGQFLKEKLRYVLYFDRSVEGLYAGAPVNFRGVKVGTVKKIVVELDMTNKASSVRTPVFIQLTVDGFRQAGIGGDSELDSEAMVDVLVERGLRASLQAQSLVTGQFSIELDFHPESEARLSGFVNEVKELPTIASSLDELTQTATETAALLRKLPLEELFYEVMGAAQEANQLLVSFNRAGLSGTLTETLELVQKGVADTQLLMASLQATVPSLLSSVESTSSSARALLEEEAVVALKALTATLNRAGTFVQQMDRHLTPLATSLQDTSRVAQQALTRAQGTLQTVDQAVGDKSPLRYDIAKALEELTAAARSVRVLADALERRPEAFLYGKKGLRNR